MWVRCGTESSELQSALPVGRMPIPGEKLNLVLMVPMAKLFLCLTEHHAMKAYWGSGGIAPLILDLGTRWMVSILTSTEHTRNSVRSNVWKCIDFSSTIYGWRYMFYFVSLKAGHSVYDGHGCNGMKRQQAVSLMYRFFFFSPPRIELKLAMNYSHLLVVFYISYTPSVWTERKAVRICYCPFCSDGLNNFLLGLFFCTSELLIKYNVEGFLTPLLRFSFSLFRFHQHYCSS
jgi:hypothetical protein